MKTAVYKNKATGETYKICNVKNLGQAWALSGFVCSTTDWNPEMFSHDVRVTLI